MVSLKAPAKVNLSLYITGVRFDGYHLLDTVMQSVSLYDTVTVKKNKDSSIKVVCDRGELSGEKNICHKASELFFSVTGINGGADIYIEKRIPLSAGLGGGSADAAAVLKGLNALYGEPLKYKQLKEIALKLGADVPFCIDGGTARVKGVGEEIEKIDRRLPLYMLLIKEGEKPSTAFMYKEFDRRMASAPGKINADAVCNALINGDYGAFTASVHNDFSSLWDCSELFSALTKSGADSVSLSGSGPTVIGFFETERAAGKAYENLKEKYDCIYLVRGENE